jgi:hypothetical protein
MAWYRATSFLYSMQNQKDGLFKKVAVVQMTSTTPGYAC